MFQSFAIKMVSQKQAKKHIYFIGAKNRADWLKYSIILTCPYPNPDKPEAKNIFPAKPQPKSRKRRNSQSRPGRRKKGEVRIQCARDSGQIVNDAGIFASLVKNYLFFCLMVELL